MSEFISYVVGFLFDESRQRVVLIQKTKPAWQAGRFNGVGGKVEPGETELAAIRREFREETGLDVPQWDIFINMKGKDWTVAAFRAFGDISSVKTTTEEEVHSFEIEELPEKIISNVRWLIPLALNTNGGIKFPVQITYEK